MEHADGTFPKFGKCFNGKYAEDAVKLCDKLMVSSTTPGIAEPIIVGL